MKMARRFGLIVLIAIVLYLWGYWPTKRRLDKAGDQLRQTSAQLSEAQEKLRIIALVMKDDIQE